MDYAEKLLAWFDMNKREMPWRKTRDPYCIWVSEVMLQQTQVVTVIPYYERFIARFPSVFELAKATQEEVYTYWQGLGYYRRADNLHKGAKMIVERWDGVFPMHPKEAKEIPGIGPYTLGAVLSISYGIPLPAVDGNVMRVLSRQFLIEDDIAIAKSRKVFEEKVMTLMPDDPNRFNQALMELGATICTPTSPKCERCPMEEICMAYEEGVTNIYPIKTKKQKVTPDHYIGVIFKKGDCYYLEKRGEEGLLANMWGIPLLTEEEWHNYKGIKAEKQVLEEVKHVFTHRIWLVTPIIISIDEENERLFDNLIKDRETFFDKKQLKNLPIGTAFLKILKKF